MPRLVIDAEAMQLAMRQLEGQAIHAGPDGGLLEPGVIDLVEESSNAEAWQPADSRTRLLALGAEACRDVLFHSERLLTEPSVAKRATKAMAVPICNLMDVCLQLQGALNDDACRAMRGEWLQHDQDTYRDVGRRLRKKHRDGPVRRARDKTSAHLDPAAYELTVGLSLDDVLGPLGDAVMVLLLALNHKSHAFAWIRCLGETSTGQRIVETMFSYPIAVRWLTDADGKVLRAGRLQLAANPQVSLQGEVVRAAEMYNTLAALEGSSMPQMWLRWRDMAPDLPDAVRLAGPIK